MKQAAANHLTTAFWGVKEPDLFNSKQGEDYPAITHGAVQSKTKGEGK